MKKKLEFQYYYKRDGCKAKDAKDGDCICWHDEGTGPYKDERHSAETPLVNWRIKPSNGHNKVMSLQQALEFVRTLAKHNPFVRMKDGFDRGRRLTEAEQELANQAGTVLSRMANTEELEDLMKNERWKAMF